MNLENKNHSSGDDGAEQASLNGSNQFDEAQLTAYVLGELAGDERAADRETVERQLAASEAARAALAEIRRSAELMTAALATEPAGTLTPAGRENVESRIEQIRAAPATLPLVRRRQSRYRFAIVAASLLLGFSGWLLWSSTHAPRKHYWRSAANPYARLHGLDGVVRGSNDKAASKLSGHSVSEDLIHDSKSRVIADGVVSEASVYKPEFEAAKGATAATDTAKKNPQRIPYTINKPVYETKTRSNAKNAPSTINDVVDDSYSMDAAYDQVRRPMGSLIVERVNPERRFIAQQEARAKLELPNSGKGQVGNRDQAIDSNSMYELGSGYFEFNTEAYSRIVENPFLDVRQNPLSTFSIDVDTASYANVRRFLTQHALPPKDAVRIEELVNYFKYDYAPPAGDAPFAVHAEIAGCPWAPKHRLLRVALKGREIDFNNRPASNLVFLIDVSGSMDQPNKLPLLKAALRLLIDLLSENDRIAMVVYAGSSGLALPSTTGDRQAVIAGALEQLQAGGSTNGASGIQLAYETARQNFIRGGVNRVILCTDGDFNVGVTDQGALTRLIETEAKSDVFLSVLGFGDGNYKDATMESLADRGNGNYAYIDNLNEARKVLVEQAGGMLVTIAKDVKLQLEFNPRRVAAYRLLGYENRMLRNEDFNDDAKDAGEIGAGHTVTAFYELAPAGDEPPAAPVDPLKYQQTIEPSEAADSDEVLTLKLRYKAPDGAESKLIESVVKDSGRSFVQADADFQFAASVAAFGLVLRDSQFKGDLTLAAVEELATASRGADEEGYRAEFIGLVKQAQAIGGGR